MKSNRLARLSRVRLVRPRVEHPPTSQRPLDTTEFHEADDLPYAVKIAASWAWRLLVIAAALGVLVWLMSKFSVLIVPLMIAALLTGLLGPLVNFMHAKLSVPRGLAVALTLIAFLASTTAGLSLAGQRLGVGFAQLWQQALVGIEQVQTWLFTGPLQLSNDDLQSFLEDTLAQLRSNSNNILSEALSWGSVLGQIVTGFLLTIFALIFMLLDGRKIASFLINLLPRRARPAMDGAVTRGWTSMVRYVRVQLLVALIDAVGIGLGAFILGVPLALPLSVLVFMGSFIPVIGALLTGALAVLLALVANGWVNALIMLAVVLVVQQAESHILQPLIMGKAVSLHPLAVVLAVAGGTMIAGIAGALFAVPAMAVLNTVVKYLANRTWENDQLVIERYGPPVNPTPATSSSATVPSPENDGTAGPAAPRPTNNTMNGE